MKNKKLLGLGIGGVICICLASGFMIYNNNNEAMETMAMGEQKEEETLETLPLEAEENMDEKEQKEAGEAVEPKEETTVEPLETSPLEVEESVGEIEEKNTEAEEATTAENGIEANSTSDNIELNEDEYKGDNPLDVGYEGEAELDIDDEAIADEVMKQLREEHPEWFTDESSANNSIPQYENLGPVDSGEFVDPVEFGSKTSDVPAGTVY